MLSAALALAGRSNATSTARSPAVRKNVKPRFCVVFILKFYLLIVCLVGFIGARAVQVAVRYCGNLPTDWRNPECGCGIRTARVEMRGPAVYYTLV